MTRGVLPRIVTLLHCYIVTLLHCYIYDFSTHIETLKYMTSPTNQNIGTVGDEKAIGQS